MATKQRISTRVLLVCAAIGVATGLVSAVAGYLSVPALALSPLVYGIVLTAHLLPGIVAQEMLRQPWVALITHLLAALVAVAVSPQWIMSYVLAVVLMGGLQEGWAAVGRYRRWSTGWFILSGLLVGIVLGFSASLAIGLSRNLSFAMTAAAIGITVVAAVGWTLVGVSVGRGLRRAGLTRTDRA